MSGLNPNVQLILGGMSGNGARGLADSMYGQAETTPVRKWLAEVAAGRMSPQEAAVRAKVEQQGGGGGSGQPPQGGGQSFPDIGQLPPLTTPRFGLSAGSRAPEPATARMRDSYPGAPQERNVRFDAPDEAGHITGSRPGVQRQEQAPYVSPRFGGATPAFGGGGMASARPAPQRLEILTNQDYQDVMASAGRLVPRQRSLQDVLAEIDARTGGRMKVVTKQEAHKDYRAELRDERAGEGLEQKKAEEKGRNERQDKALKAQMAQLDKKIKAASKLAGGSRAFKSKLEAARIELERVKSLRSFLANMARTDPAMMGKQWAMDAYAEANDALPEAERLLDEAMKEGGARSSHDDPEEMIDVDEPGEEADEPVARRTDPATGETRVWNGTAWIPE